MPGGLISTYQSVLLPNIPVFLVTRPLIILGISSCFTWILSFLPPPISADDFVSVTKSTSSSRQNKLVSFYPGKFYRNLLSDNIVTQGGGVLAEKTTGLSHSPIIGWAYDGNPIYGPYGNGKAIPDNTGTGGVKKIYSSYEVDVVTTPDLRPPGFANGYFAQDYVYKASGDLDEYNGRYLVNSDFPNGTYAYFSTLDVNGNLAYPYITKSHYNYSD